MYATIYLLSVGCLNETRFGNKSVTKEVQRFFNVFKKIMEVTMNYFFSYLFFHLKKLREQKKNFTKKKKNFPKHLVLFAKLLKNFGPHDSNNAQITRECFLVNPTSLKSFAYGKTRKKVKKCEITRNLERAVFRLRIEYFAKFRKISRFLCYFAFTLFSALFRTRKVLD